MIVGLSIFLQNGRSHADKAYTDFLGYVHDFDRRRQHRQPQRVLYRRADSDGNRRA